METFLFIQILYRNIFYQSKGDMGGKGFRDYSFAHKDQYNNLNIPNMAANNKPEENEENKTAPQID